MKKKKRKKPFKRWELTPSALGGFFLYWPPHKGSKSLCLGVGDIVDILNRRRIIVRNPRSR